MFRICFDDEDMIPGFFSGRIRHDRRKMEVIGYDLTRGRIIYKLCNKDLND
ncbi:hypothetical protein ACHQM5_031138 [Ranunculus cassubicifolius]